MAFCLVLGTHDFRDQLRGYENITAQCHNCGNWSAHCISEWPFFTICFIPAIPLALHKYKLVACPICNFKQDLSTRPDVQSQGHGGGGAPPPGQGQGQWQGQGHGQMPPPQQQYK